LLRTPVAGATAARRGRVDLFERWGPALAICGVSATPTEDLAGKTTAAGAVEVVAEVDALAAAAVAAFPAALEVPEAALDEPGVLEEPDVLEEPGVLEEPELPEEPEVPEEPEPLDELELLEEPEEVLTGVRRERPDERCLRSRPLELAPSVEVLSADAPSVVGAAAWGPCSGGWEPCPCGKSCECEPPRPPRDGSPWGECAPPDEVTCGEGWVPAGWPWVEDWLLGASPS
jgi:hypothetical protein